VKKHCDKLWQLVNQERSTAMAEAKKDPNHPRKHIDPRTGIWPMSEWGWECARGFVSDARFDRGEDRVIKRASRETSRKWYRSKSA
jgi:hypothetical protein